MLPSRKRVLKFCVTIRWHGTWDSNCLTAQGQIRVIIIGVHILLELYSTFLFFSFLSAKNWPRERLFYLEYNAECGNQFFLGRCKCYQANLVIPCWLSSNTLIHKVGTDVKDLNGADCDALNWLRMCYGLMYVCWVPYLTYTRLI